MEPFGNSTAPLCQGKVNTEDIADNASDLNYWRHIATQDFAAMLAEKENSTHTHTTHTDTHTHSTHKHIQHTQAHTQHNHSAESWQEL